MSDDRRWNQRVRLFNRLLLGVVDQWCREEVDFPVQPTVASLLYLLSARCDPFSIAETELPDALFGVVASPATEFARTWPALDAQIGAELIDRLSLILENAVEQWEHGSLMDLAVANVGQKLVDASIEHGYFKFHRYLTTCRDGGGFHGHG
jgi:hypothetical protein